MNLQPRRNGWCAGPQPHDRCPVEWGYWESTVMVYRCDCPCHGSAEDRGQLW